MFNGLRYILASAVVAAFAGKSAFAQTHGDFVRSQLALKVVQENLRLEDRSLKMKLVHVSDTEENGRVLRSVTLTHAEAGTTKILLNAPKDFDRSNLRFPVVFVSAGFLTGAKAAQLIPTQGKDIVVVGYEYPTTEDQIKADPSQLPKAIRVIPGQIALVLEWIKDQSWANPYSIHPVGVSLGSLFLPISLKLAEARGFIPRTTSFLFGGAHIQPVLENLIGSQIPANAVQPVVDLILGLTAPYDPKLYLPLLRGPFLHVFGSDDQLFPRSTSVMQFVLLPQPKESHEIKADHIDPSRPKVIKETAEVFLRFLEKNL